MTPPSCGECGSEAVLVTGDKIYRNRPDLYEQFYWYCLRDGAYVGTHAGTMTPLGVPAGRETREARKAAHAAFDPLWRGKARGGRALMSRERAYKLLSTYLGLTREACHIGLMDAAMCRRVIEVVPRIEAWAERSPHTHVNRRDGRGKSNRRSRL